MVSIMYVLGLLWNCKEVVYSVALRYLRYEYIGIFSYALFDNYLYFCVLQCELMKSGFREDIVLNLRHNRNTHEDLVAGTAGADGLDVVGVSYTSPVLALPRPCEPNKVLCCGVG